MLENKFNNGDLVRYVGSDDCTRDWVGLEGKVSDVDDGYVTMTITKGNSGSRPVGSEIFPDADNLELVQPKQVPIVVGEAVTHPAHYGGDTAYEVIKVCEAWGLDKDAYLFNVVKYVARAGKKDAAKELEDLRKGLFYYQRRIKQLEEASTI